MSTALLMPVITTTPSNSTMDKNAAKSKQLAVECDTKDAAGGRTERLSNSGNDDFADAITTNYARSSKRSSESQEADIRNLQMEFNNLARENDMLKEILNRVQRGSVQTHSINSDSGDKDAKIEEMVKNLQLEQRQQPVDSPQLAPLSDCDDTSDDVPRTIDVSHSSEGSGCLCDIKNSIEQQPQQKKKYNYCRTEEEEGEIDYFVLYS